MAGWYVHEQIHVVVLITGISPRTALSSYVCGFQFARFEMHRTGVCSCHQQEVLAQEARIFWWQCGRPTHSASKQLPLSLLLFNNFLSFLCVCFCPPLIWTRLYFPERSLNHLCYRFVCLFFVVSCQQDSEDNILETQNMFIHNLVHAIAHHLAFDLCSFIVFNATIDTLALKYFLSFVFVLKVVFF